VVICYGANFLASESDCLLSYNHNLHSSFRAYPCHRQVSLVIEDEKKSEIWDSLLSDPWSRSSDKGDFSLQKILSYNRLDKYFCNHIVLNLQLKFLWYST
jgi:hypothetical protein